MHKITYTADNASEVTKFIGSIPDCPFCKGKTETCKVCSTTLIPFIDFEGDRCYLKIGETLEKQSNGLHLSEPDKKRALDDFITELLQKGRTKSEILAVATQTRWAGQTNKIKETLR